MSRWTIGTQYSGQGVTFVATAGALGSTGLPDTVANAALAHTDANVVESRCFGCEFVPHSIRANLSTTAKGVSAHVASGCSFGATVSMRGYTAGGAVQTYQYIHLQGTVYRIPAIALHIVAVLSNTAPIGVTRGPGFAETVNILERLIDAAAVKAGFDRAELRRLNMVPADAMPPRHSQFVKVSRDPFIFSLGARLICVDHDIRPHF